VVVIGGGVAGMEAARMAKQRGHQVTLLEKSNRLGGNVSVASVPYFKADLKDLIDWYKYQLDQLKIEAKLNFNVTPSSLGKFDPEIVIIATGADYAVPNIEGNRKKNVMTATDVLKETKQVGAKVVIIGGGLVGVETALHLYEHTETKEITVLEVLPRPLSDVVRVSKLGIMEMLAKTNIKIITSANVIRVKESEVQYSDRADRLTVIAADTVVLAAGFVSKPKLEEFTDGIKAEVYRVGDCRKAGKIYDAINFAASVALRI
jgi:2-enoate reductase